jgi:septal ring factor EnvC (AmiA/AmiB activator)
VLLIAALLFSFHVFAQPAGKGNKQELQNKSKRLNKEIEEINDLIKETAQNKEASVGNLQNLNLRLTKRAELISTITEQLRQIEAEIKKNEKEVESLRAQLKKLKDEYGRMIVQAQKHQDAYSGMMFIFSSESFSQAYARLKYIQQYAVYRKKQAQDILKTEDAILEKLRELKLRRSEKNALLGIQEQEVTQLASEKTEQEKVLTTLQKREKELKKELEKKKRDAIQLQLAIRRMIDEEIRRKNEEIRKKNEEAAAKAAEEAKKNAVANKTEKKATKPTSAVPTPKENPTEPILNDEAIALSEDFANNRGKLPWPVVKGVICEGYGEHEHPAIKGFMMFNNGVEICATKGMQARAVFSGEVTGIADSPTGGKLVIIRHGEYLSVYSNLEEVLVKKGQKVTVKQPIGTVMYNEDEGKTSMSLQIWKGQKTMDPAAWLINAR